MLETRYSVEHLNIEEEVSNENALRAGLGDLFLFHSGLL